MDLLTAFRLDPEVPQLISLVGGGGKTTTMFALAQALKSLQKRVLVTTTTNILYPGTEVCDRIIVDETPAIAIFRDVRAGTVTVLGRKLVSGCDETKLVGIEKEFVEQLFQEPLFDHILVEADGSRQKPIKAPASYEPVIPESATLTIGVIGLDALGKPISEEHVHRLELFCRVVNRRPGDLLDAAAVVELIVSSRGLFQGVPAGCPAYVLLNKADDEPRRAYGEEIRRRLREREGVVSAEVIIASMAQNRIYS